MFSNECLSINRWLVDVTHIFDFWMTLKFLLVWKEGRLRFIIFYTSKCFSRISAIKILKKINVNVKFLYRENRHLTRLERLLRNAVIQPILIRLHIVVFPTASGNTKQMYMSLLRSNPSLSHRHDSSSKNKLACSF